MATNNNQTLRDELASYNQHVDAVLRERLGMSFKTFKAIKASTQLVGGLAGIYAMHLGAPPMNALILTTAMIVGPEGLEVVLNETQISTNTTDKDE